MVPRASAIFGSFLEKDEDFRRLHSLAIDGVTSTAAAKCRCSSNLSSARAKIRSTISIGITSYGYFIQNVKREIVNAYKIVRIRTNGLTNVIITIML